MRGRRNPYSYDYRKGADGRMCFVVLDPSGRPTRRYCFSESRAAEMVAEMNAQLQEEVTAPLVRSPPRAAPRPAARPVPDDVLDPEEEQVRRIRLALFEKFSSEGYSKYKPISVNGHTYGPGQPLTPVDAKQLAFQMAGRRRGSRFLQEGTNEPTLESRARAYEKLSSPDAEEKRQRYEKMLAVGRKSGAYRITHEHDHNGELVWMIQPGNKPYATKAAAERALARLQQA